MRLTARALTRRRLRPHFAAMTPLHLEDFDAARLLLIPAAGKAERSC